MTRGCKAFRSQTDVAALSLMQAHVGYGERAVRYGTKPCYDYSMCVLHIDLDHGSMSTAAIVAACCGLRNAEHANYVVLLASKVIVIFQCMWSSKNASCVDQTL